MPCAFCQTARCRFHYSPCSIRVTLTGNNPATLHRLNLILQKAPPRLPMRGRRNAAVDQEATSSCKHQNIPTPQLPYQYAIITHQMRSSPAMNAQCKEGGYLRGLACLSGKVMKTVVPSFSLLLIQMLPLWSSTIRLEMASPKPKPLDRYSIVPDLWA